MHPSTETDAAECSFGREVLTALLRRIADVNADTDTSEIYYQLGVSHAWLDGPVMYIVHTTKPSEPTWGLARDTRMSLISEGAWSSASEAAMLYYYLDFEEGWADAPSSGDRDEIIHWRGDPLPNLPRRVTDIPTRYRCVLPTGLSAEGLRRQAQQRIALQSPRRYADPRTLPPDLRPPHAAHDPDLL